MKQSRRQELRTNELILKLIELREFVETQWQIVVGAVVVVALIIGGGWYWSYSASVRRSEAMNDLFAARQKSDAKLQERLDSYGRIAGEHSDPTVTLAVLETIANDAMRNLMVQGPDMDATSRESALDAAQKACDRIRSEFQNRPDALCRAYLGLAAIAENRGNKDEARKNYKAILDTPALAAVTVYQSIAAKRESTLDARMEPVTILPALPTTTQAATQPVVIKADAPPMPAPAASQPVN